MCDNNIKSKILGIPIKKCVKNPILKRILGKIHKKEFMFQYNDHKDYNDYSDIYFEDKTGYNDYIDYYDAD